MSIDLDQKGISINGPEFNAIAPSLQSNILKSHSRDHARLLFLKLTKGKPEVSLWIRNFISQQKFVISALDQKVDSAQHKANKAAQIETESKTVANFYLTASGYEHLGFNAKAFSAHGIEDEDENDQDVDDENILVGNNDFVRGMKSKKVNKNLKDPAVNEWEQGYNTDIHAMILLADDEVNRLEVEMTNLKNSLVSIAIVVKEEVGTNITDIFGGMKRNIEHFGYADGVSQPTYFTEGDISSPFELQPLNILLVKDPFTEEEDDNYGSFLVYRKLEQDVKGFNDKVAELAPKLTLNANQTGKISKEEFAGALAVGRFKDGTPLVKSDINLNEAPAFNNFKYEDTDRPGHKCPFHAHIRKSNPRGQGLLVPERYVTRRGIPYGDRGTDGDKGLLFMCFQSNLKGQFNFLQKTWANNPGFPPFRGRPGIDPLIGQGHEGGQSWPKEYGSDKEVDFDFAGFIKMMGGEYFFAPSLGFLKNM